MTKQIHKLNRYVNTFICVIFLCRQMFWNASYYFVHWLLRSWNKQERKYGLHAHAYWSGGVLLAFSHVYARCFVWRKTGGHFTIGLCQQLMQLNKFCSAKDVYTWTRSQKVCWDCKVFYSSSPSFSFIRNFFQ